MVGESIFLPEGEVSSMVVEDDDVLLVFTVRRAISGNITTCNSGNSNGKEGC